MPRIELESTLLVLPFENICQLLTYMTDMLQTNQQVEMCVKAILFIIRLYEVGRGMKDVNMQIVCTILNQ